MTRRVTRLYFDLISPLYEAVTNNPLWQASLHEMARHFPPSGAELTMLDAGCGPGNSARQFQSLRPDLRVIGLDIAPAMLIRARHDNQNAVTGWSQADLTHIPLKDASVDAVTAHSVYYLLPDRAAFLQEALRVLRPGGRLIMLDPALRRYPFEMLGRGLRQPRTAVCILGWHTVSRFYRRFSLETLASDLTAAGFARVLSERAVEGYGVLSRGEKPFAEATSTVARIAQVAGKEPARAAAPNTTDIIRLVAPADLPAAIRGNFVFTLVEQTPNKPAWALKPGEQIRWEAATVTKDGQTYLLAFSSLPKAVQFMQPAVVNGALVGINKVAKFAKERATGWNLSLLLNADYEKLTGNGFTFSASRPGLDPATAVTGEE